MQKSKDNTDIFELYDLKVETSRCREGMKMVCNHPIGSYFLLSGENLSIPDNLTFPLYPLAALIPLLPVKQRMTHENDWVSTDAEVACPDPNCGGIFKITRLAKTKFRHQDVTVVPVNKEL